MATYFLRGKTYTVAFRLPGYPRQYLYGIKSEQLARRAKEAKDHEEQLAQAGLFKPNPRAARIDAVATESVYVHIENFRKDLLARGKNKQHAHQQAAQCTRLFKMARLNRIGDLARAPLQKALDRLLGPKCGPRTCNAARQAVIQFERYLEEAGAVAETALHNLERFNEQKDIRRKRRPLTQEEVDWLVSTTAAASDGMSRRCGISPEDRAVLYGVGIGTGFRRKALLSLNKGSFFLIDREKPFVRLAAKYNKNGKDRDQLIAADLAGHLQPWLKEKPETGSVWHPSPHADLSLRFRKDLEAARAAWIAAAVDAKDRSIREQSNTLKYVFHDGVRNVFADFHGLRHTGITFVVRKSGIRVGQEWAGHSTPVLTARYAEVDQADLTTALTGLPAFRTGPILKKLA